MSTSTSSTSITTSTAAATNLVATQSQPNVCTVNDIPVELLAKICSFFTQLNDIRAFLSVNQHNYSNISNSRPLWDAILQNRFPNHYQPDFTIAEIKTLINLARYKVIDFPNAAHVHRVSCLEMDGDKLFSGSEDSTIKVWDVNGGKELLCLNLSESPFGEWPNCFKVQGGSLFLAKYSNILILDLFKKGKIVSNLVGHAGWVTCLLVDEGRLYSADDSGGIKSWDVNQTKELTTFSGHAAKMRINCLATYKGNLISGSSDCTIKGWDTESGKELYTLTPKPSKYGEALYTGPQPIRKIAIYGNILFAAAPVGSIEVWDLEKKEWLQTLIGHENYLRQGMQTPKFWLQDMIVYKDMLITCSTDKTIKLWNAKTRKEWLTLNCSDEVHCIAMHEDKLAAGLKNGWMSIWEFNIPSTAPQDAKKEEEKTG